MASAVKVRRARLSDAEAIATFVNVARGSGPDNGISRSDVAQRFGQDGFMVAEDDGRLIGLLGWQVENLVVRVVDLLVASTSDPLAVGQALVDKVEAESEFLVAEAVLVFLPRHPSTKLTTFWKQLGYASQEFGTLPRAWREAVAEYGRDGQGVMVKRLRDDLTYRPI